MATSSDSSSLTFTVQVLVILKYFRYLHLLSLAVVPAAVHHDGRDEQCADTAYYPLWQKAFGRFTQVSSPPFSLFVCRGFGNDGISNVLDDNRVKERIEL